MKFILFLSIFIAVLQSSSIGVDLKIDVRVEQNIKALYRDVNITDEQKKYIIDNEEQNIKTIQTELINEISQFKQSQNIDEKNVVEFELNRDGKISNIELLATSNNRRLDKISKQTLEKVSTKLVLPKENIKLRFIFKYSIKNKNDQVVQSNSVNTISNEIYIKRGTTRFEHSNDEYIRVFETNGNGFINFNTNPKRCTKYVTLLSEKGKKIRRGSSYWQFNVEVPKGKYKLLIQTKEPCSVNLQYP